MQWLARWYARRLVNVNINILAAGAMAIAIMYAVMWGVHQLAIDRHIADKLKPTVSGLDVKHVNMALSFVIDLVADLAVYYVLHWYANHAPRALGRNLLNPAYSDLSFLQDATKVQIERMILSPILYGIAMGLQYFLMDRHHVIPPKAAAIGFAVGILTTRTLHTAWMLFEEHRGRRKARLAALKTAPPSSTRTPTPEPKPVAPPARSAP